MTLGVSYDTKRAGRLRALVAAIDGVEFADFNYANNRITAKFDPDRLSPQRLQDIIAQERKHRLCSAERQQNDRGTGD